MRFSLIIPVFNRPGEVDELLTSAEGQTNKDFEVVVVEDGSQNRCEQVCKQHSGKLNISYFFKDNSGPGQTRNYGAQRAKGDYLLILDSDVVLPSDYIKSVADELDKEDSDAFGGPDRAHDSFTTTQKAISYSMTSFITTGGIRGGKKKLDKFYPRSFNMGLKASVYKALGGFSNMRFGEDIDLSIRIFRNGYKCRLFPEAWVWHKRRTDFHKFFRQVFNSGIARINLFKKYPDSLKAVHMLPAAFTIGFCILSLGFIGGLLAMAFCSFGPALAIASAAPLLLLSLIIFADSAIRNQSLVVGFKSIGASFIQLLGYGSGFITAWWKRCINNQDEFSAFNNNFYK